MMRARRRTAARFGLRNWNKCSRMIATSTAKSAYGLGVKGRSDPAPSPRPSANISRILEHRLVHSGDYRLVHSGEEGVRAAISLAEASQREQKFSTYVFWKEFGVG